MRILNTIINKIDQILFNESCISCKIQGEVICKKCIKLLPSPENDLPQNIYSLYEYRNPVVKKVLTDAKYRKKFSGLKIFGRVMADMLIDIVEDLRALNNYSKIIIIPVPISKKRLSLRGFNQSEIIAESVLSQAKNLPYEIDKNIVIKIKNQTPQASIKNKKERLLSPINSFAIKKPEKIKGSLCIIIDDITTTGATINELSRILLKSGAAEVIGITIAH